MYMQGRLHVQFKAPRCNSLRFFKILSLLPTTPGSNLQIKIAAWLRRAKPFEAVQFTSKNKMLRGVEGLHPTKPLSKIQNTGLSRRSRGKRETE